MKNSTTALVLSAVCMIANVIANLPQFFIASSIFASAHLIIAQLEENDNKL
jgi:hypothetical protein